MVEKFYRYLVNRKVKCGCLLKEFLPLQFLFKLKSLKPFYQQRWHEPSISLTVIHMLHLYIFASCVGHVFFFFVTYLFLLLLFQFLFYIHFASPSQVCFEPIGIETQSVYAHVVA